MGMLLTALLLSLTACAPDKAPAADSGALDSTPAPADPALPDTAPDTGPAADTGPTADLPPPGATLTDEGVTFAVRADPAERVEVWLYAEPKGAPERLRLALTPAGGLWIGEVSAADLSAAGLETIYYGLRAWGPNWPYDDAWTPGSEAGFKEDVDADGHRFNPNKLLLDPYAREISHDAFNADHSDGWAYTTGPDHRLEDTAPFAPKGLALPADDTSTGDHPGRPLADQIIYEVHLRGLTRNDPEVDEALRGTYAGAAQVAGKLADLGVTAVEFLPVFETQNEQNDLDPESADGDNYWGYVTSGFFAPDRRYAYDTSPGGPTRELREMVRAFHEVDIAVYLDVVYNHTSESSPWDGDGLAVPLFSWRGLDNPGYYELSGDPRWYRNDNGVGPNWNAASAPARDLVIDSLRYWVEEMGVDGFRFDLASVLGNACDRECFSFDPDDPEGILRRAHAELPDTVLIAEPWGVTSGTYQLGAYPEGWAEWNSAWRDEIRSDQNQLGAAEVTPGQLANRLSGSWELFGDDGREPWRSINYVVSHDGFTLRDLYACSEKDNDQPWPYGPSDGGSDDERSWDQGGDPTAQRQATRTGMALLMVSAGVPMITGGDELYRSQSCNNNAYNLDASSNWLDPAGADPQLLRFAREAMRFRGEHPALRPDAYRPTEDSDGDGLKRITWRTTEGEAGADYLDNPDNHFLAFHLDGDEVGDPAAELFVVYNGWEDGLHVTLPAAGGGRRWHLVADTHPWLEGAGNWLSPGEEQPLDDDRYLLGGRSVLVLLAR